MRHRLALAASPPTTCLQVLGEWGGVATYLTAGSKAALLEQGNATLLVPFAVGGADAKHDKPKDAAAEATTATAPRPATWHGLIRDLW